ncbi:ribonuclease HI [Trypanosoma cruzi]|nr:ribonuclease HI [Trypanosoma cruzi]
MLMTPSCYFPPLDGWSLAPARCGRQRPVLPPPVASHGREWTHRRHGSCERSCGAGTRQAETSGFRVGDVSVPPITQNNTFSPRNFVLSARRFAGVRPAVFHRNAESRRKSAAH